MCGETWPVLGCRSDLTSPSTTGQTRMMLPHQIHLFSVLSNPHSSPSATIFSIAWQVAELSRGLLPSSQGVYGV
jgi:hypothetical protein